MINPLNERDANVNDFVGLLLKSPRTDCPQTLSGPAAPQPVSQAAGERAARLAQPLPEEGNIIGVLFTLVKADIEMSDGSDDAKQAILEHARQLKTRGDVQAYAEDVMQRVDAARQAQANGGTPVAAS